MDLLKSFIKKRVDDEWYSKFSNTAIGSLYIDHLMQCIENYLPPEEGHILDIGIDPGIFTEYLIKKNRQVTICDLSEEQIRVIRERFENLKLSDNIDQYVLLDALDELVQFEDETFNLVICFFETMSYASDLRYKFMKELMRILKRGAPIIFTVKSKLSYLKQLIQNNDIEKLVDPLKSGIWELLESKYKQPDEELVDPAYYAFESNELIDFVTNNEGEVLEICAVNILLQKNNPLILDIKNSEEAWKTILEIERRISSTRGLVDSGDAILIVGRKSVL
ncbi:MAG: class I SAM-dependent methyltransferase [Asgard group archaeon]|nr:class I SAM-dependent methyltransferase [Asgard group archaeon]